MQLSVGRSCSAFVHMAFNVTMGITLIPESSALTLSFDGDSVWLHAASRFSSNDADGFERKRAS